MSEACLVADAAMVLTMRNYEKRIERANQELLKERTEDEVQGLVEQLEQRRDENVAQIAELRKALSDALEQLEKSEGAEAERILAHGFERLEAKEPRLCENTVVNAVVDMERNRCSGAGVDLLCDLGIPELVPLSQVQLAAVLFNLLDNAFNAVRDGRSEGWIRLEARVINDNLAILVENPCASLERKAVEPVNHAPGYEGEHGWGMDIVDQIAHEYDGTADFAMGDGVFSVLFMVPMDSIDE